MKPRDKQTAKVMCLLGLLPVVWLALTCAPYLSGGILILVPTLNPLI